MSLFGAAYAAPNKGTTILYWFRSPQTLLNPLVNGKIQGLWVFLSTFQGKFYFQGLFKTVPYIQVLFKPVQTPMYLAASYVEQARPDLLLDAYPTPTRPGSLISAYQEPYRVRFPHFCLSRAKIKAQYTIFLAGLIFFEYNAFVWISGHVQKFRQKYHTQNDRAKPINL